MQQSSRRARTVRIVRQVVSVVVALTLLVGGAYVLLDAYSTRADASAGVADTVSAQEPGRGAGAPLERPTDRRRQG